MFVRYSTLAVVLFLNFYYDTVCSIQCQKTLEWDKEKLDKCDGDLCVTNIVTTNPGGPGVPPVPVIIYGCLTGFEMKLGCFSDSWNNTVCTCKEEMCNANPSNNNGKATKTEVECYTGRVVDGQIEGNATCMGQGCILYYADTVIGIPAEITAGCIFDMQPTYHTGRGCLLFPNSQGNDTWQCRCQENLCNSPSSFDIPQRTGSVKCGFGYVNANTSAPAPFQNRLRTCTGDFCILEPIMDPSSRSSPLLYSKKCMSISNGAKVDSKRFKDDIGKSSTMYVCNKDNCNDDIDTAVKSIGGNGATNGLGQITVVVPANESVVVNGIPITPDNGYNNTTPADQPNVGVDVHYDNQTTLEFASVNNTTPANSPDVAVHVHPDNQAPLTSDKNTTENPDVEIHVQNNATVAVMLDTTPANISDVATGTPANQPSNTTIITTVISNGTTKMHDHRVETTTKGSSTWTISTFLIIALSGLVIKM